MPDPVRNFTVIESAYGRFVVNRHCAFQAEHLIKTGLPHIEAELRAMLTIVATLPADCVLVDAGANIGLVSIPMAQAVKSRGGIVHAFEVQRMLHYALCGGAALNDLVNLVAHHRGLGARAATVLLPEIDYGKAQDFGALSLASAAPAAGSESVDIVALDALALPRLDFLKVDVEGMELDVLDGARATIERCLPWCWIEYWLSGVDPIKARFAGLDYEFYRIDTLNMLCAPRPRSAGSGLRFAAPAA